jgi:hypothetical protein
MNNNYQKTILNSLIISGLSTAPAFAGEISHSRIKAEIKQAQQESKAFQASMGMDPKNLCKGEISPTLVINSKTGQFSFCKRNRTLETGNLQKRNGQTFSGSYESRIVKEQSVNCKKEQGSPNIAVIRRSFEFQNGSETYSISPETKNCTDADSTFVLPATSTKLFNNRATIKIID